MAEADIADIVQALHTARAEEREACARIADEYATVAGDSQTLKRTTAACIAKAIRQAGGTR